MKNITIIGTGYVGLVTGTGLSELGHNVICVDKDNKKIERLNHGEIPIYEPGLKELLKKNYAKEKLSFTTEIEYSIQKSEIVFIAVGTPEKEDGDTNLEFLDAVVELISNNLNSYKIVCTKSTVPVGTGNKIIKKLSKKYIEGEMFDYVSNPEFLREGSAINDFLYPDRVVIGVNNNKVFKIIYDIYSPLKNSKDIIIKTSIETSEMIKYAANSFLALKISYINEVANLCEVTGADIIDVAKVIGMDHRISNQFLNPGPGYGGSCFPKDLKSISFLSKSFNCPMFTIEGVIKRNNHQKKRMVRKLLNLFDGNLNGCKVAVLGLAFKSNTDDVRESPSIDMINGILEEGGLVNAYDPIANDSMSYIFDHINYFSNVYDAVNGADWLVVMTEWDEFKSLDLKKIKNIMHDYKILDTRNIVNMEHLSKYGFKYDNIGRMKL